MAEVINGIAGELVVRCKECALIFPGDLKVQVWEDHWTTLHGDPPVEIELLFRGDDGALYEMAREDEADG